MGRREDDSTEATAPTVEVMPSTVEELAPTVERQPPTVDLQRPADTEERPTDVLGPPTVTLTGAPPGSDLAPGTHVGEYVIERKVGSGGMGSVFAAVHPVLRRRAAIKVIAWELCRDPSFVDRFVAEARAVNLIRHPNIVQSFSIGRLPDGRSYYAMEWLDGVSLRDRMESGRLPLAQTLAFLDGVADALEAVHAQGVIHRDLTPQNLFLVDGHDGVQVKVFDFGLAKQVAGGAPGAHQTQSGVMMGTPIYASPEQACGERVDERTDIYALGSIAFEMILGRPPFVDARTPIVVARKLTEKAPAPRSLWPAIPRPLSDLIERMLAIEPGARPSLREIRATLAQVRALPDTAAAAAPGTRRWPWVAAALGLVSVAIAIGWRVTRPDPAPDPNPDPIPSTIPSPIPSPSPSTSTSTSTIPSTSPSPSPSPPPSAALELTIDADGASVDIDGELVASAVRRVRIPVAPGEHRLAVTAAGRRPYQETITIAAGAVATIDVALPPAAAEQPARRRRPRHRPRPGRHAADDPDYLIEVPPPAPQSPSQ